MSFRNFLLEASFLSYLQKCSQKSIFSLNFAVLLQCFNFEFRHYNLTFTLTSLDIKLEVLISNLDRNETYTLVICRFLLDGSAGSQHARHGRVLHPTHAVGLAAVRRHARSLRAHRRHQALGTDRVLRRRHPQPDQ